MKNRNVLVTGGAGFFGVHLARDLLASGHRVRILDIADLNDPDLEARTEYLRGDICDPETARKACAGMDAVIHNAAVVPISRSGSRFWRINVEGTKTILEAAKAAGVRKVVYISSSSAYGIPRETPITESTPLNPFGDYGRSKAEGERLCTTMRETMDISIVRPRTILGTGRLGILQILFEFVEENRKFYIFGPGSNRFQLISAPDLAAGCRLCVDVACRNQDFNFGAESFQTLRKDLEGFVKSVGSKTRIISVPTSLTRNVLRVLDLLRLSPFVDYHYHILNQDVWFDTSKARKILGWKATESNVEMLANAYWWYRAHKKELKNTVGTSHRKKVKMGLMRLVKLVS